MAIVGVLFGVAYAVSSAIRGELLAGIVTGAIGALLVFLVLDARAASTTPRRAGAASATTPGPSRGPVLGDARRG